MIRRATLSDRSQLADLARVCALPWDLQAFTEELERPWAQVWLDERQGEVVGFAIFWWVGGEADLHAVATRHDWRRQGVARGLLEHVIQEARGIQARRLTLEVAEHNDAARSLYHALGFQEVGRRVNYYPTGDGLVLALDLTYAGVVK